MKFQELYHEVIDYASNLVATSFQGQWKTKAIASFALGVMRGKGAYGFINMPVAQSFIPTAQAMGLYNPETEEVDLPTLLSGMEQLAKSGEGLSIGPVVIDGRDIETLAHKLKEKENARQSYARPPERPLV